MSMTYQRLPHSSKSNSKKRPMHRFQTHSNPLSDRNDWEYPTSPEEMNWHAHYPRHFDADGKATATPAKKISILDIGCGFGGLTVSLGQNFPDSLILGLEIRKPVVAFVEERIQILREENKDQYQNISVLATNAMKLLPNFFEKGQISKMFFLFPDPHFKKRNNKRRIITRQLLCTYAYLIPVGGELYTITDVKDLAEWMQSALDAFPLFERINDEEWLKNDVCANLIQNVSEEAKKVDRFKGDKHMAIYRRIE